MNNITQNTPAPRTSDKGGKRVAVSFAAIDSYVETNIVSPAAKLISGTDRYRWGDGDRYPAYLSDLYDTVPTLHSVIGGVVDFITGDDVLFEGQADRKLNARGETAAELVRQAAWNLEVYGGFAINVIRDNTGAPKFLEVIDLKNLRTNKDNSVFWYSEKWGNSRPDAVEMPAFLPDLHQKWAALTPEERDRHASSIVFVKMEAGSIYPVPCYAAAVRACEIERNIDTYHINALENGFVGSVVISFANGIPEDEEKEEIERNWNEKFGGFQNAQRMVFCYSPDKDHAVSIESPKVEDFGDRYNALEKRSRQAIMTAFRATPNLFGIPTDSLGFSSEEYESAFKLFNRTQVRPRQRKIADAFERIYGRPAVQIIPFSIEASTETAVN